MLSVPGETLVGSKVPATVRDDLPEGIDIIEAVRRGDGVPLGVVECWGFGTGYVLADELPARIEIVRGAR